jgi:hypothetical protein
MADAMMEEYDVLGTVPKPTVESVIDSKHAVDGSIERYKSIFVARGFSQKRELTLMRLLL